MKSEFSKYYLVSHVRQLSDDMEALKEEGAESITGNLSLWLAGQFAIVARVLGEQNEKGYVELQTLRNLNADVIALRRSAHAAERLKFDREKYEFSATKAAIQHANTIKSIISDKSQGADDRIERVRRLLFGDPKPQVNPAEPGESDKPGETQGLMGEGGLKEGQE
jgi:small-conductance mechanosensitive channel